MRTTRKQVEGAFGRLHRAMGWTTIPAWTNGKANVGAVYLADNGPSCFNIEVIANEGGGVHTPFGWGWTSKSEAFDAMATMARAVEEYKKLHNITD